MIDSANTEIVFRYIPMRISASMQLKNYFERIGYHGDQHPNIAVLGDLQRTHLKSA